MDDIIPEDVRIEILQEITPSEGEIDKQQQIISTLTDSLVDYSETSSHSYSFIEAQGSTGKKQTQLKGAGDIDLFVALSPEEYSSTLDLPNKERREALDRILDSIVDEWFIPALTRIKPTKMIKTYSQHPYLSLEYLDTDIDVIVCFNLSKENLANHGPVTAVDRTVHHTQFVAEKINDRLREDIRLLKSFVRASHTYGDICPVGQMGFTGYSLELLVILQDGIDEALYAIRNLHQNPIDVKRRSLETLVAEPAFRDNHVFIIDPTDTNRNVASSFSKRSYNWLRLRTMELLGIEEGTIDDYREILLEAAIPRDPLPTWIDSHAFAYTFNSDGKQHYTILRDKLYRYARKIASQIQFERTGEKRFGEVLFEIIFANLQFSLGFLVEKVNASETYTRQGPPIGIEGSKRFSQAHENVYEEEGYLWVEEKRRWTEANTMLEHIIGKHNIKGLDLNNESTELDAKVKNVLMRYILPIEPEFPLKGTV